MHTEHSEDIVADQLVKEGYLVIRTYRRGCPDIIAFKPEDAHKIVAREVKLRGTSTTPEQKLVLARMKEKGIDAQVVIIGESRLRDARLTKAQRMERAETWFTAGWDGYLAGKGEDDYPRTEADGTFTTQRDRGDWKFGWYKASQVVKK